MPRAPSAPRPAIASASFRKKCDALSGFCAFRLYSRSRSEAGFPIVGAVEGKEIPHRLTHGKISKPGSRHEAFVKAYADS